MWLKYHIMYYIITSAQLLNTVRGGNGERKNESSKYMTISLKPAKKKGLNVSRTTVQAFEYGRLSAVYAQLIGAFRNVYGGSLDSELKAQGSIVLSTKQLMIGLETEDEEDLYMELQWVDLTLDEPYYKRGSDKKLIKVDGKLKEYTSARVLAIIGDENEDDDNVQYAYGYSPQEVFDREVKDGLYVKASSYKDESDTNTKDSSNDDVNDDNI